MRRSSASWLAALLLQAVMPGAVAANPAMLEEHGAEASAWFPNIAIERRVEIPMRDGVTLRATLFRPDAPGRFPAIVYRTPYGQEEEAAESAFPRNAARRGYLVFLVDVRGRYSSDGAFEAYRNEKIDGFDVIEWVAAHPRSSGRVGSYGQSYPGYVQWLALSQSPPHYATAVPTMTPTSSHHFFFQGGAFNQTWFDWFVPLILPDLRRRAGDASGPWDVEAAYAEWVAQRRGVYMQRPLLGPALLRRWAPYYYEWASHPDDSAWWRFADVERDFRRMRVPVLLVTGWYDNNYGPVGATRGFRGMRSEAATREAREHTKLMIGPWTHSSIEVTKTQFGALDFGPNAGLDFDAFLLRWFDARLKEVDNGIDREPPVRLFVMGDNVWRDENEWPPARAQSRSLYLRGGGSAAAVAGDGRLSSELPPAGETGDAYVFDPSRPVWDEDFERSGALPQSAFESRDDVLVYTAEPLERDLEVTGEMIAELFVSTDRPDTDLAVRVSDVHPDGTSYAINGPEAGYLRLRYREGLDRQILMEPGRIVAVRIGDMLTSNVFKKGHRIRFQISSSRAPHFDPNPNTGEEIATATHLVPVRVRIHHDAEHPSRLLLPVIPRTATP
ncbi:MAG: CocE/NonD family hydrolase [Myxococcales bacterium]|nr:CocE/NonD family hydrolase [Myxococcales bacterium]MDH5307887.1 CocE/NonD family hydrolase [Myxococcales bacterium]MDH5566464.1 CocE/NonD family hydrolase [Myxococcales bacterium]